MSPGDRRRGRDRGAPAQARSPVRPKTPPQRPRPKNATRCRPETSSRRAVRRGLERRGSGGGEGIGGRCHADGRDDRDDLELHSALPASRVALTTRPGATPTRDPSERTVAVRGSLLATRRVPHHAAALIEHFHSEGMESPSSTVAGGSTKRTSRTAAASAEAPPTEAEFVTAGTGRRRRGRGFGTGRWSRHRIDRHGAVARRGQGRQSSGRRRRGQPHQLRRPPPGFPSGGRRGAGDCRRGAGDGG